MEICSLIITFHGEGLNLIKDMGSRVVRMVRNFNLENRAHRVIGKVKPVAAPKHPSTERTNGHPEVAASIHEKDDSLLSVLKSVYVDSTDPPAQNSLPKKQVEEYRPLKISLPASPYGVISDITNVPKGRLSIVEALNALNQHKRAPKTWTPEKVAHEYSLDLKDTKALLEFFFPFEVKIIPPKTEGTKRLKAS